MEWISFSLTNEQKINFETQLMPTICKRYGSLINMSEQSWLAYSTRDGLNTFQYLFCSDSPIINKFVKEFVGKSTRLFTQPDISNMDLFGPENI